MREVNKKFSLSRFPTSMRVLLNFYYFNFYLLLFSGFFGAAFCEKKNCLLMEWKNFEEDNLSYRQKKTVEVHEIGEKNRSFITMTVKIKHKRTPHVRPKSIFSNQFLTLKRCVIVMACLRIIFYLTFFDYKNVANFRVKTLIQLSCRLFKILRNSKVPSIFIFLTFLSPIQHRWSQTQITISISTDACAKGASSPAKHLFGYDCNTLWWNT